MISIITPVYNGARYIEGCIKTVIDQNHPNFEHIIIDGGSTDGTLEIINRYAAKYDHIRWVSEQDKGQSEAMNKGITMAQGEILGILNVDDFYEPNVLIRIAQLFKSLPEPSLLVGNCKVWDGEGKLIGINKPNKLCLKDLLMGDKVNPFPVNPSAYFYHTSLHDLIGPYKTGEHYAMDIDFVLRAVQKATTKYMDETWGNYRYMEGTKTFEDMRSPQGFQREKYYFRTYRGQLPLSQKWQVTVTYEFYNNIFLATVNYLLKSLGKIASTLRQ
jgi:glycosyltransferase involved in cell wall biosynthesis